MSAEDEPIPLSNSLNSWYPKGSDKKKHPVDRRVFYLSVQSVLNALVIGILAKGLVLLIDGITNIAFYHRLSLTPASPAEHHLGWMVVWVPIAGSLLVGLMARFGSKAIRGHGIPEAMEKIISEDSKIPPALTFLKPLSAAISIGTGGPFGAEGPIIATGAAFGSLTGQGMHISPGERKIMLTAGACAGMSAIFGAPLAAVLLAIELLLFEFSPKSIIPVMLACVTGAGMHFWLFAKEAVFAMPSIPVPTNAALVLYILLGAVVGVLASFVSKSVYAVEDLFEHLPLHWMWWPALGAIAVGVVGWFAPRTMGVGYENIRGLLTGSLPMAMVVSLCVLKYISWVISLGSGTSGGTLAPLFTIGGALGALIGMALLRAAPSLEINIATAALVGMAAMFAGASRALLTSIVFSLETTGQMNGLLPLLGGSVAAYFVSFFLLRNGSIMTEKIQRRGVKTPDAFVPDVLKTITVAKLMSPLSGDYARLPWVYMEDDLSSAAALLGRCNEKALLVRESRGSSKIAGLITASAILQYYSQQQQKEHAYESPARTRRIMVRGRRIFKRVRRV